MEQAENTSITKTVCGGIIKEPEKYPRAEYEGRQVYFCTQACLRAFEQNPHAFMSGTIDHPLGDDAQGE